MNNFFSKTTDECLKELNSSMKGLSKEKCTDLLNSVGENILNEKEKKSIWSVFIEQFKDFLVIILIAAAIISALTGNLESTIVIIAVILINAVLGTVQYVKAEQSLDSLKALSSPNAKVIRDDKKVEIASKDVVPGDILLLEAGDLVVADGRILENYSLKVNESSLTGESEAVEKTQDIINKTEVALGDQKTWYFQVR